MRQRIKENLKLISLSFLLPFFLVYLSFNLFIKDKIRSNYEDINPLPLSNNDLRKQAASEEQIYINNNNILLSLRDNNYDHSQSLSIFNILNEECDMRKMKPNQLIKLKYINEYNFVEKDSEILPFFTSKKLNKKIDEFSFKCYDYKKVTGIYNNENKSYEVSAQEPELKKELAKYDFRINTGLIVDGLESQVNINVLYKIIQIYSFVVDFQNDFRQNDRVILLTEKITDQDNDTVEEKLLYSNLLLSNKAKEFIRFKDNFYDRKGSSIARNLLRTPIDGARISSKFSNHRKHPILGYTKKHSGVDFAAPTGTPVYAAGDGVIEKIEYSGGYGKMILIKHNSTYKTRYAHLSKYKKDLKRSHNVKQRTVIGYVGSTGLSTGPHLHYEVIENGKPVDPSKIKMQPTVSVKDADKDVFLATIKELDEILNSKQ